MMSMLSLVRAEEGDLVSNNPKYRQYIAAVDKALKSFEYTTEWADLIAALGKLNKVLQTNSKFGGNIPKPVTVAKRLSQCLHPALPSGVHLKALETYQQIFQLLGKEGLGKLLYLFSVGLFPVLSHAGIKVKAHLLKLYETFLLPLGPALKPCCVGFVTGLLPGLEEGSEFFDKTNTLLEEVEHGVGADYFYSCLWHCVRDSPSVRLPALLYISAHFDKNVAMDDQLYIMGNNIDNMVRALCCAAGDSYPLVQRHLLDFLCFAFPLDSEHLIRDDQIRLLQSCLFVVLKRDMSLNRRLYSWLIGGASSVSEGALDLTYFVQVALPLVFDALIGLLKSQSADKNGRNSVAVKIARLLLYCLDKGDMGLKMLESTLFELLLFVESEEKVDTESAADRVTAGGWRSSRTVLQSKNSGKNQEEFIKTLNLLLNCLDPGFIWTYVGEHLENSKEIDCTTISHEDDKTEKIISVCRVTNYLIASAHLDSHSDIRSQQLPKLLLRILCCGKRMWGDILENRFCPNFVSSFQEILLVACRLLREIQQASGAVELKNQEEVVKESMKIDTSEQHSVSEEKDGTKLSLTTTQLVGTEGQVLVEQCLSCYQQLLAMFLDFCLKTTDDIILSNTERRELCKYCFQLLREFSDYPLCGLMTSGEGCGNASTEKNTIAVWLEKMVDVCLGRWLCPLASDFEVESGCLEVLLYMMVMSNSVLEQVGIVEQRRLLDEVRGWENEGIFHAVFLRPVLPTSSLKQLELTSFYQDASVRLWGKLSAENSLDHENAARLFCMLHSCQLHSEGRSCCEDVCLKDLSSENEVPSVKVCAVKLRRMEGQLFQNVRYEGAEKFHRVWCLTRNYSEEICAGVVFRPFNRVVLVMLSSLSASGSSGDLVREASWSWFQDCLQHGDMPKILQTVCLILLHPGSTRVSVQYLNKNMRSDKAGSKIARNLLVLRNTARECLFHLLDSVTPCGDLVIEENRWLFELRRQLLGGAEQGSPSSPSSSDGSFAGRWRTNFDEDFDDGSVGSLLSWKEQKVDEIVKQVVKDLLVKVSENVEYNEPMILALEEASVGSECVEAERLSEGEMAELTRGYLDRGESLITSPSLDLKFFDGVGEQKGVVVKAGEGTEMSTSDLFHPLHAHFLLYSEGERVEITRSEVAFNCLTNFLRDQETGLQVASCLASSGTGSMRNCISFMMNDWMARHVKGILGKDFWKTNELVERGTADTVTHKQYMFLELFLTVSLYYLRSYHLNSPIATVRTEDLEGNWRAKIACLEFMDSLVSRLCDLIEEQGKSFASYVSDSLVKCKLQKCLLHCMMASTHDSSVGNILSVDIARFNAGPRSFRPLLSGYQRSLLNLVGRMTELEFKLKHSKKIQNSSGILVDKLSLAPLHSSLTSSCPLVELRLFLLTVLNALKRRYEMHEIWLRFVQKSLPYLDKSLPSLTLHVAEQLSRNLQFVVDRCYDSQNVVGSSVPSRVDFPTNYLYLLLEALTALFHHCLSDSASGGNSSNQNSGTGSMTSGQGSIIPPGSSVSAVKNATGEIITNLVRVFTFQDGNVNRALPAVDKTTSFASLARSELLGAFPHVLSTLCNVWSAVKDNKPPEVPVGMPQDVFPVEVSVLEVVDGCLQSCPVALLRTSWPSIHRLLLDVQSLNVQPPALFMTFFILADYVRMCCNWNEEDKVTLRGMQDVCMKITEAMNAVVGWQLEQTTWLKRTLVVRRNSDIGEPLKGEANNELLVHSSIGENLSLMGSESAGYQSYTSSQGSYKNEKISGLISKDANNNRKEMSYSAQALNILADNLSTVIDTVCKSEDKERLLPTLHAVWSNVLPYLKTRSERNAKNFYASSKFLANLSQYSYTRSVWRKATLELVTDGSFFRMDMTSLCCWLTIVDNLMTHDKTTFKELLGRISVSQGPSLFTSKDQEYDMRASSLKRLAFVLLSSEIDQYQPHLPDIQEKLSENLRLFQVPHVHAQVFLCFRVLLIRLSPQHLTSIWPALITELVQVLLQIEQDLSEGPVINNDYRCARDDQWLQLYLSACKLLDALCTLPSWHLTQFQMYQWAFASSVEMERGGSEFLFIPHVTRISELFKKKYGVPKPDEIEGSASLRQIRSVLKLKDLRFFFNELSDANAVSKKSCGSLRHVSTSQDCESVLKNVVHALESSLHIDFMESWQ